MDVNQLALVTQWLGTLLTVSLLGFLALSVRRPLLWYWAWAWLALATALLSLAIAFSSPRIEGPLKAIYFFGEYVFVLLVIAGCRNLGSGERIEQRWLWVLLPALILAFVLAFASSDFNVEFIPHAAILGIGFVVAFRTVLAARRTKAGPGISVMLLGLLLLAVDFFHYVPVFVMAVFLGPAHRFAYLDYTSVVDMVLEVLLGFGMVMSIMDQLRGELEEALAKLEVVAHTDGLTNALNRHAFQSLVAPMRGCVVIADVDRLKEINDTWGHGAGDLAIRSVASALRSVIRADDLLFRWGGDEFLIVLSGVDEEEARGRFERLEIDMPAADDVPHGMRLSVSFGFASFGDGTVLEESIREADSLMYRRKQARLAPSALRSDG